jgi:hypothetical protein
MSIVMISESLLQRAIASDGRILRDRVRSGFGVRLKARKWVGALTFILFYADMDQGMGVTNSGTSVTLSP